jgi:hypothetical protein
MPENSTPRNLPHLTQQEVSERDRQEDLLSTELHPCVRGENVDAEKAFQLLCHYTLEIFNIHWSAYLKRPGFTRSWTPLILEQSILRAMVKANEKIYDASKLFYIAVRDEVFAHLQQYPPVVPPPRLEKAFPVLTGKQSALLAKAGIDPTHPISPLLMMAAEAAMDGQGHSQVFSYISEEPKAETSAPSFAAELSKLLIEARWTPEAIADEMRIDWRTVYRHRKGEILPSLKTVALYEAALSKKLKRTIVLPVSGKRQNASKKSGKRQ